MLGVLPVNSDSASARQPTPDPNHHINKSAYPAPAGIILNLSGYGYRVSAERGIEIGTLDEVRSGFAERRFEEAHRKEAAREAEKRATKVNLVHQAETAVKAQSVLGLKALAKAARGQEGAGALAVLQDAESKPSAKPAAAPAAMPAAVSSSDARHETSAHAARNRLTRVSRVAAEDARAFFA